MGKRGKDMGHRKSRILLGRLGEGYKESLLNLAKAFGDAGFEVIFTELQDPEAIVSRARLEFTPRPRFGVAEPGALSCARRPVTQRVCRGVRAGYGGITRVQRPERRRGRLI